MQIFRRKGEFDITIFAPDDLTELENRRTEITAKSIIEKLDNDPVLIQKAIEILKGSDE